MEGPASTNRRSPRGYVGIGHETIGSDILAVLDALHLPEDILGPEMVEKLRQVKPAGWYPASWLIDSSEVLDSRVGRFSLLRVGRKVYKASHQTRMQKEARSPRDIVYGIDAMYRRVNRGKDIGSWQVLSFSPGRAELEKTTPHHCFIAQGILLRVLADTGVPVVIEQPAGTSSRRRRLHLRGHVRHHGRALERPVEVWCFSPMAARWRRRVESPYRSTAPLPSLPSLALDENHHTPTLGYFNAARRFSRSSVSFGGTSPGGRDLPNATASPSVATSATASPLPCSASAFSR